MTSKIALKALYYPYARCSNEATLKRAVLIFDEVGFVDPTSQMMREGLITDKREIPQSVIEDWETIRDSYDVLLERGIVKLHDPEPLIAENDQLLGAALRADLDDDEIWKLCTGPNTPETWSILRRKVPPSAFEFLNSQTYGRINYGTARAKAYFHRQFLEWPNLEGEFGERAVKGPFDERDIGDMEQWYRYLFHDGKIAREMNSWYLEDKTEREQYMQNIEFSCVFPYTHGSSITVNTALLLSDAEGLIPFTDSRLHHDMLSVKFGRVVETLKAKDSPMSGAKPLHPEKLRRIALTLLDVMVPNDCIDQMSIADCVKYRDASSDASDRLKLYIGELASQIESEPWTDEFEQDVQKLVHQKILPEARKAKDKGTEIYEKLFGKIAKRAAAALTPTLGASVFAGLTLPLMLAVGSAAALGAVLPDLIDALVAERAARRNSVSYLLELAK